MYAAAEPSRGRVRCVQSFSTADCTGTATDTGTLDASTAAGSTTCVELTLGGTAYSASGLQCDYSGTPVSYTDSLFSGAGCAGTALSVASSMNAHADMQSCRGISGSHSMNYLCVEYSPPSPPPPSEAPSPPLPLTPPPLAPPVAPAWSFDMGILIIIAIAVVVLIVVVAAAICWWVRCRRRGPNGKSQNAVVA